MFAVGYGIANRENKIKAIAESEPTTAVILAAVHFEWVMKRVILKLGSSSTAQLREELEGVYKLDPSYRGQKTYKSVWTREIARNYQNAQLGTILGNLPAIKSKAIKVRGKVIHGNGTVSESDARDAIGEFLKAGQKMVEFAAQQGQDLDTKLKRRTQ